MLRIYYTKTFLKRLKKLDTYTQQEAEEKIELFRNPENHERLEVHKLKGKFSGNYAFSVNKKDRIMFKPMADKAIILVDLDDHDIYK